MILKTIRSNYLIVILLGFTLMLRAVIALSLEQPGYMDAYYYYNVAASLYRGEGFTDHVLWNFLNNPAGLPHPACLYWMPLTAAIIYPFFLLLGETFRVAQIPFVLLSTILAWIAYRITVDLSGKRDQAILAVLLVVFSGFYTVFWVTTDSFALFAVVASLSLYAAGRGVKSAAISEPVGQVSINHLPPPVRGGVGGAAMESRPTADSVQGVKDIRPGWFILSGGLAGLSHLSRADGALVMVAVILTLLFTAWQRPRLRKASLLSCLWAAIAYLVVMAPWLYRNWQLTGTFLGTSGIQTLFLRGYDDLFSYGRELTLSSYLDWGWGAILESKLQALWFGFQNLLAVNLMIFLAPLVIWGLWTWRRKIELLPFAIYAVLLYFVMTLLFTFPGVRGGLFHSSAALLPWFFAAAAAGLERFIRFMVRRRAGWRFGSAYAFFFAAVIFLAFLLSGFLYWGSVHANSATRLSWNERNTVYMDVGRWLQDRNDDPGPVMVNNAPGFYYYTHLPAISIPNEDLEVVLEVAQRYGVVYLVLEFDHPVPLRSLYNEEQTDRRLNLKAAISSPDGSPVKIYRMER